MIIEELKLFTALHTGIMSTWRKQMTVCLSLFLIKSADCVTKPLLKALHTLHFYMKHHCF